MAQNLLENHLFLESWELSALSLKGLSRVNLIWMLHNPKKIIHNVVFQTVSHPPKWHFLIFFFSFVIMALARLDHTVPRSSLGAWVLWSWQGTWMPEEIHSCGGQMTEALTTDSVRKTINLVLSVWHSCDLLFNAVVKQRHRKNYFRGSFLLLA